MFNDDSSDIDVSILPWGNEYVKRHKDFDVPAQVHFIQKYDNGLMIVTFKYKAYLNVGSTKHEQLLEALEVWEKEGQEEDALFCVLNKKGKPDVGKDSDFPKVRWFLTENKYVQVMKEEIQKTLKRETSNPLLAGRGVKSTGEEKEAATSTSPIKEAAVEPSGRARKAQ